MRCAVYALPVVQNRVQDSFSCVVRAGSEPEAATFYPLSSDGSCCGRRRRCGWLRLCTSSERGLRRNGHRFNSEYCPRCPVLRVPSASSQSAADATANTHDAPGAISPEQWLKRGNTERLQLKRAEGLRSLILFLYEFHILSNFVRAGDLNILFTYLHRVFCGTAPKQTRNVGPSTQWV